MPSRLGVFLCRLTSVSSSALSQVRSMTGGLIGGCVLVGRARIFFKDGRSSSPSSESKISPYSKEQHLPGREVWRDDRRSQGEVQRENCSPSPESTWMPLEPGPLFTGKAVQIAKGTQCERDALRKVKDRRSEKASPLKKAQLDTYSWNAGSSRENCGTDSGHDGSHYRSWPCVRPHPRRQRGSNL